MPFVSWSPPPPRQHWKFSFENNRRVGTNSKKQGMELRAVLKQKTSRKEGSQRRQLDQSWTKSMEFGSFVFWSPPSTSLRQHKPARQIGFYCFHLSDLCLISLEPFAKFEEGREEVRVISKYEVSPSVYEVSLLSALYLAISLYLSDHLGSFLQN